MKNHWLDKKIDKEIDKAFEINLDLDNPCEFKDSNFIDLSVVSNNTGRYKEYDRLDLQEKFIEENIKSLDPFDFGCDEHDRAVVVEILLKYKDKPQWIKEVLSEVGYSPNPDSLGNLTIDTTNAVMFDSNDNFTITMGDQWPDHWTISTSTVSGDIPGGDGIKLGEVKTSEFGEICPNCNEEMWPMNTATTMCQGDPACACNRNSCNLGIFYAASFIQNETLQVLTDLNTDVTQYQTTYVPVLPGTMTGTIYPTPGNTSYGFVFYVSSDGKFTFDQFVQDTNGKVEYASKQPPLTLEKMADGEFDDRFMGWYDEAYVDGTTLNLQTGVLELHYHMGKRPEIIVSYEYNREWSL